MINLSVIICTHNPRQDYLRRTLDALRMQTLPIEQWELLLIDNASKEHLSNKWDLSWHRAGRHLREEELGLTAARLCGIAEAKGHLLVFVDDDCVLDSNYLRAAVLIAERRPDIGAWGGQCMPSFEEPPQSWTRPFWPYLAIRQFSQESISRLGTDDCSVPWGAGLCVRAKVANAYRSRVEADPVLKALDRRGSSGLSACGDVDLALTSCDEGFAVGTFPELRLLHLIPKNRLREEYLVKVVEGFAYSSKILWVRRRIVVPTEPINSCRRFLGRAKRLVTMKPLDRRFFEAFLSGEQKALFEIAQMFRAESR